MYSVHLIEFSFLFFIFSFLVFHSVSYCPQFYCLVHQRNENITLPRDRVRDRAEEEERADRDSETNL